MAKKILVAESDNTVQQVVSYFLNLEGFDVTTAGNGVAALEEMERSLAEVVLLNPGLAGINGIEVSRLIREKPQFKNTPILFLVDNMDSFLKMAGDVPAGYGVIHKPIDPTKMVNTIKEYIEKVQPSPIGEKKPEGVEELLGWGGVEDTQKGVMWQGDAPQGTDISAGLFGARGAGDRGQQGGLGGMGGGPVAELIKGGLPEGFERDLRGRVTDEMIENVISKIARDVIERVAWDVVPKIAEEEIKREIERLKGEGG